MKATYSRSNNKFILAGKKDDVWHYSSRARKIHYPNSANQGINKIYWTTDRKEAMYETEEVSELFQMVWKDCGQNFEDFKLIDVSELYS